MLYIIFPNTEDFTRLLSNETLKRQYISDVYFQKFTFTFQGRERVGVQPHYCNQHLNSVFQGQGGYSINQ